ncbi:MAG: leucyl/phenylalanyl-tRNA--protein transferase [Bacteroidetes bacterium]|jgi:leucyl/phenylalanyl-tRNA--protein transferase|nr:leucyl/phenylalanyl-tRNA--protein transferase [Bacteroidota bacterium]
MTVLDDKPWFPPPEFANEDGLLAIGGDLTIERLLLAYRSGIFPWYNDAVPLWWHPNPRFVLYPQELKISKSMKQVLKKEEFVFTNNAAFEQVIANCQKIFRKEQDGSWINKDVIKSYTTLHILGFAHSAEAWYNNELVGGLYGIKMGNIFFGESMFSHKSNASKFAFIKYVQMLIEEGVELIDCQIYTEHLESLGARMIDRNLFMQILKANI